MNWHSNKFAQFAETTSKILACAALFSIVLPTALPNIFLALFFITSIIAGNFKFKYRLIRNNSIALICVGIFLLFVLGLAYTSASTEEALSILKKYCKFIYVPLLLCAFYERRWKKIGYIVFLSGVTLMMLLSYMTLFGWSPDSIYSATFAGNDEHLVFRDRIEHATLVAFSAYLFIQHAIASDQKFVRTSFILLAILASLNVLVMITSRSGQVLWMTLMVLLAFQYLEWRRLLLGLVIIPILALSIIFTSETTRKRIFELQINMVSMQEGNYANSLGWRVIWAKGGWDIFKRNPIIGTGTGSFQNEFEKYVKKHDIEIPTPHAHRNPHNGYVNIGVQLGVFGLILLIMLFVQQWRISNTFSIFGSYTAKGFIVTVVISNFMNAFIYNHTEGIFFAIFTSLLFSAYTSNNLKQA